MEVGERRPLSTRARLLVGVGSVGALGLMGAILVPALLARAEASKRAETQSVLDGFARRLRAVDARDCWDTGRSFPPWSDGSGAEGGQRPLIDCLHGFNFHSAFEPASSDAWGRRIIYRSPGPVHRHGWDLYSVGPNGIDEQGRGDDILIGEDVAAISSQ
jgi:hypothetical protein